jgi:GGDEF domain-containing protein
MQAAHVARRISAALREPYEVRGFVLVATATIGVVEIPDSNGEPSARDLMARVDSAIYKSKRRYPARRLVCVTNEAPAATDTPAQYERAWEPTSLSPAQTA